MTSSIGMCARDVMTTRCSYSAMKVDYKYMFVGFFLIIQD